MDPVTPLSNQPETIFNAEANRKEMLLIDPTRGKYNAKGEWVPSKRWFPVSEDGEIVPVTAHPNNQPQPNTVVRSIKTVDECLNDVAQGHNAGVAKFDLKIPPDYILIGEIVCSFITHYRHRLFVKDIHHLIMKKMNFKNYASFCPKPHLIMEILEGMESMSYI